METIKGKSMRVFKIDKKLYLFSGYARVDPI
jgi:hypothetical protein